MATRTDRLLDKVAALLKQPSAKPLKASQVGEFLDAELREYQLAGLNWLRGCRKRDHGAILGDEMGLGKTIQSISYVASRLQEEVSLHLVVVPLSVLDSWRQEFAKFAPRINVSTFHGDKEERIVLQEKLLAAVADHSCDVVLTTFDLCLRDCEFFTKFAFDTLIVDEAHRLKNSESKLYICLAKELKFNMKVLLTGTPVQNDLNELYSLLRFVHPKLFRSSKREVFLEEFADVSNSGSNKKQLHTLLKPFLLRRVKSMVAANSIPGKEEILLYTGLSEIQKKYYKSILMKDADAFSGFNVRKTSLLNTLMQLRKCINHPYLFDGVEPEPFKMGEHLVEASGKLQLLDAMLPFLKKCGHRVLIFSQMTRILDILQDYLTYRQHAYERLDGSVRGEERFAAINNFNKDQETFVFLLSTRAGGLGLNLVGADTVIFYDSDFNPQNDLQAAARAHRIGQTRPVKILRLVARNTAEELVVKRANAKMKLTQAVIEGGQFAGSDDQDLDVMKATSAQNLSQMLKFGLDHLFHPSAPANALSTIDLENMLGKTEGKKWVLGTAATESTKPAPDSAMVDVSEDTTDPPKSTDLKPPTEAEAPMELSDATKALATDDKKPVDGKIDLPEATFTVMETDEDEIVAQPTMIFEGVDYTAKRLEADKAAFDELIAELMDSDEDEGRPSRRRAGTLGSTALGAVESRKRKRKEYTPEELEARAEARRKRARIAAENKKKREAERARKAQERKEQLEKARRAFWDKHHYQSTNLPLIDPDEESRDIDDLDIEDTGAVLECVVGNVTMPTLPKDAKGSPIIVHVVDNSGSWGKGGVFAALSRQTPLVESAYETAAEMNDLELGDTHLIELDLLGQNGQPLLVALIVAQKRDKNNQLSPIQPKFLDIGMQRLAEYARQNNCTVHMPRIGHTTPKFNWYGTERVIRKRFVRQGVSAFVYYYKRRQPLKRKPSTSARPRHDDEGEAAMDVTERSAPKLAREPSELPTVCAGMLVYFHRVDETKSKSIRRKIIAFDGEIADTMNNNVTHVVYDSTCEPDEDADSVIMDQMSESAVMLKLIDFDAKIKKAISQ